MSSSKNIELDFIIKEPEGVDFIIQSPPLTDTERKEISEFIRARKLENSRLSKRTIPKKTNKIKI